jgi:hypothetical protein
MQTFQLIPYPAKDLPQIQITGEIERTANQLSIRYEVTGDVDSILLPSLSTTPARKDDLWKATCFEFFIAMKDQTRYREFNLSPSGDWNVYVMDAYRQVNMREESAISQLPFQFQKTESSLLLSATVDLNPILSIDAKLDVGITTIVQTNAGNESYWALLHPGAQADFHMRKSFTMELDM